MIPREPMSDVRVGEWSMPWNAKADARGLGPGIPKSDFRASAKEEIDQLGCVHTEQGFEFDFVGVDATTRDFFLSRVERSILVDAKAAEAPSTYTRDAEG